MTLDENWTIAICFVLSYEGGYVNDPNDPGGETKYGISRKSYPNEDIKGLTVEKAKEIYRRDFWNVCRCDDLPGPLAIAVFDGAVNHGVGKSVRMLQTALGVKVDGDIGPVTIAAAKRAGRKGIVMYLLQRAKQYLTLRNARVWGRNWGERLIRLAEVVIDD